MDRAERRFRTRRRQLARSRLWLRSGGTPLPMGYWARRTALGCNCRSRKHGQPGRGVGVCCLGPRPARRERQRGRRLQHLALRDLGD